MISGFKSLASSLAIDGGTIANPTTPSLKKAIPKFALLKYLGLKPLLSSTLLTPS